MPSCSPCRRWPVALAALAVSVPLGGPPLAAPRQQEASVPPAEGTAAPVARASRTTGPILIDGALDEPDWKLAPALTSFTQRLPAEGESATQPTEVRILYDDERLYIGAELRDSEVGRLIALEMKEDGDLENDDLFGILLDTFHDRRNGFYFETNPNGARGDALVYDEGRTVSFDWDGVWEAASRITGEGWTVEVEIPFKTLHFDPVRTNPWGLQLWRYIRRNSEDVFWSAVPRSEDKWRVSRAGELQGLQGIRQGKSLAVKPYALGGAARRPTLGETAADGRGEIGLDTRYDVTPNLAAVLTVNTDFAETEVDEEQVNTTRFPLFFPEKREFFLESTGYFDFGYRRVGPGAGPGVYPFFSRAVGLHPVTRLPIPIQGGVKIAGRLGRYNLGLLSANTDEDGDLSQTNYSVLRVSRDFLTRSNWGVIGVSKEPAGPDTIGDPNDPSDDQHSNRTFGADLNFSVLENFKFGGSLLQTRTPGVPGGEGSGHAYATWSNDRWEMQMFHRDTGAGFKPEAGFIQRTGIEETEAYLGWSWRSDTARVRRIQPHARVVYIADQEHHLATRRQHWATAVEFRNGGEIEVGYNPIFDELTGVFELPNGALVPPGAYPMDQYLLLVETDPSRVVSADLFAEWGDFFDGEFASIDTGILARFSRHFRARLSVLQNQIDLPERPPDPNTMIAPPSRFDFTLANLRLGVTFTTRIFLDALLQYDTARDDVSSNLRFNYKYRPGSDLYVVYTERRDIEGLPTDLVDRAFTVKWTWLMAF